MIKKLDSALWSGIYLVAIIVGAGTWAGAACGPTMQAKWTTVGVESARCLGTDIIDAAGDALVDLLSSITTSTATDWNTLGRTLGLKYGADAVMCALGKAYKILVAPSASDAARLAMSDGERRAKLGMVDYLIKHPSEWTVSSGSR